VKVVAASRSANSAPVSAISVAEHVAEHRKREPPGEEAGDQERERSHRRSLDRIEIADRDAPEQRDQRRERDSGQRPLAHGQPLASRLERCAASSDPGQQQAQREKKAAWRQRRMKDVLGVDDAVVAAGRGHGHRVGRQHRVAEQNQHQRWRHQHAERGGNRDDRVSAGRGNAFGLKPGRDHARQPQHAGADRAVHRPEQCAQHHARHQGRRRAARQHRSAGAIQGVRDRQPVKHQAHGHVERQGLQQVILEQVDQPDRQRPQCRELDGAGEHAEHRAEYRRREQDDGGRQAGRDDAEADQQQQREPAPRHYGFSGSRGRMMSSSACRITMSAISTSAILIRK
jgi:hypothetical protein